MSRRPPQPQPPPRRGRGAAVRYGRMLGSVLLLVVALTTVASGAWAYWTATGTGTGTAATSTLNPPTDVVATSTPGSSTVGVTWTASTGLAPEGYFVTRVEEVGGASAFVCASSPTELVTSPCPDTSVPNGSFRYLVTAVYNSWTAGSAPSDLVTVSSDGTAPTVTSIERVAGAAQVVNSGPLSWTVTFSEPVSGVVESNFDLATNGGITGTAPTITAVTSVGVSPSATWTVTASTTGATGGNDGSIGLDLTSIGSIKDAAANPLSTTTPYVGQSYTYDTTTPTVTSIVRAGTAQLVNTGPLSWTVTFSEPVSAVAGTDFGLVPTGITGTTPTITGVNANDGLTSATWTVTTSMANSDGADDGSVGLNLTGVGSIVDAATNDLSTTTPVTGESYNYDTTPPAVTDVTSTLADGSYRVGQEVPVTVTFSEPVTVAGPPGPSLTLATASQATTPVEMDALPPGQLTNILTFTYTVVAGDNSTDLNYAATTSLAGTITDAATNGANMTLPGLTAPGSLGTNKDIVIDTTTPVVTVTTVNGRTQTFPHSTKRNVTSIGGECGSTPGDLPTVALQIGLDGGAPSATVPVTCSAGSWTYTLNPVLSPTASMTVVASQDDEAGNVGTSGTQTISSDRTAPTVTGVSSTAANGTYGIGAVIPITITFTEPVTVKKTPSLGSGPTAAPLDRDAFEMEVVRLVNKERVKAGLAPLEVDPGLM